MDKASEFAKYCESSDMGSNILISLHIISYIQ